MESLKRSEKWRSDHVVNGAPAGIKDERGAALILVMVILVMLTFIGLAALSTSSTELFLSANYRQSREAFEAAEGGMDAELTDATNFDISKFGGVGTSRTLATLTQGTMTASGTLTYIAQGQADGGFSSKMGGQKANFFVLDTTGTSSLGASNRQELILSKVVP